MEEKDFLKKLKSVFKAEGIRHTALLGKPINKVAVCGGAGSFLTRKALQMGADIFVTADVKYHEFFDAEGRMVLADIGHYESEQFTVELLHDLLVEKFPTFAVQKSGVITNPVRYF
jgi:putative NIF3 family GTP cyclohydrolase 1 type 2